MKPQHILNQLNGVNNMNKKKIFAIAILALVVFCCLNVASAGWFDFLTGGSQTVNNKTVSFDNIFSLQLPEDAVITNNTTIDNGQLLEVTYNVSSNSSNYTGRITTCNGTGLIHNATAYANNLVTIGGSVLPDHGNWTIINTTAAPRSALPYNYVLTMHDGSNLLTIEGDNLTLLEQIADTYKK